MDFITWFFIGYFFIGFIFASIGVIAVSSDHDIQFQIKKDGDPQSVPYFISLTFLFVIVFLAWPVLIAKMQIRKGQ